MVCVGKVLLLFLFKTMIHSFQRVPEKKQKIKYYFLGSCSIKKEIKYCSLGHVPEKKKVLPLGTLFMFHFEMRRRRACLFAVLLVFLE